MGLQLARGEVTVVLGEDVVRRRLLTMLYDGGDASVRLTPEAHEPMARRLERLHGATQARLVVVDRLTAGLDAATRRVVLRRIGAIARNPDAPAILVDDDDVVAALAVADRVLRVDPQRGLMVEAPDGPTGFPELDYRAS